MEEASSKTRGCSIIRLGKFTFLPYKRELRLGQQSFSLTRKENGLLSLFCDFANNLLPRNYALVNLWEQETYFNARSMDVYVSRLRKYLKPDPEILIMNIHGKGVKMLAPSIEIISADRLATL